MSEITKRMPIWQALALTGLVGLLAAAAPADNWVRPTTFPSGPTPDPDWYKTANLWATLTDSASGADFDGFRVTSKVYRMDDDPGDGNPWIEGLAFVYKFEAPTGYAGIGLDTASFYDTGWEGYNITGTGIIWSTATPGISTQVGSSGWTDGTPYAIQDRTPAEGPKVFFTSLDPFTPTFGTKIGPTGGQYSAEIFFEVPKVRSYRIDEVSLQDGGTPRTASVLVAPVPSAVVLGCVGFGCAAIAVWRQRRRRPLLDTGF